MDWLSQFALQLSANMFIPAIMATVVFAGVALHAEKKRREHAYASDQYVSAVWRQWVSAQATAIMWIVYIVLASVPAPNYTIQNKVVIKYVTTATKYEDAYNACKKHAYATTEMCDLTAKQLVLGKGVDRKFVVNDVYSDLYAQCMNEFKWATASETGKNSKQCHEQVLQVRRSIGLAK